MIDKFLKIAKVNNLDDFYKKYPTEAAFFKAHPEAKRPSKIRRPKKQNGGSMDAIKQLAPLVMQLAPLLLQDGGNTDQAMQLIEAYAQAKGTTPEELIDQLQDLQPEEQQQALQQMQQELQSNNQEYKYGGIHINPKNKGKFNALKKRTGKTTEQLTHSKNPLTRKRAIFAQNSAKWKHQNGGEALEQPQQEMQEASQMQGQEQSQGNEQMVQQLSQMVIQALQQGMQPEQIIQMLVQQGIPQEVAVQILQMVMQHMQGQGPGQQYQPQGNQYQGPQPIQAQNGGMFFNQSYSPLDY